MKLLMTHCMRAKAEMVTEKREMLLAGRACVRACVCVCVCVCVCSSEAHCDANDELVCRECRLGVWWAPMEAAGERLGPSSEFHHTRRKIGRRQRNDFGLPRDAFSLSLSLSRSI